MTVKELVNALQAMVDHKIINPECEIGIRDVIHDDEFEIIGYDLYTDGSLNLKVRDK